MDGFYDGVIRVIIGIIIYNVIVTARSLLIPAFFLSYRYEEHYNNFMTSVEKCSFFESNIVFVSAAHAKNQNLSRYNILFASSRNTFAMNSLGVLLRLFPATVD